MSTERTAISAVIYNENRSHVIAILRADDPSDRLANLWGLPAVGLRGTENDQMAIERIGRQKLGAPLSPSRLLGEKTALITNDVRLTMRLWEASAKALPNFSLRDMSEVGVSQYVTWQWMEPYKLVPTAQKGSLCTQVLLRAERIAYE